jgi:hypothetical protein
LCCDEANTADYPCETGSDDAAECTTAGPTEPETPTDTENNETTEANETDVEECCGSCIG